MLWKKVRSSGDSEIRDCLDSGKTLASVPCASSVSLGVNLLIFLQELNVAC